MNISGIQLRKRKGFTFLEILIVVVIIGILAAIAIPNFIGMTDRAKIARIQSDLQAIGVASEMYYMDKGSYPAKLSDLVTENASDSYLQSIPKPPVEDTSYSWDAKKGEASYTFKDKKYSSRNMTS